MLMAHGGILTPVAEIPTKIPYGTLRALLTPVLLLAFRPKIKGLRHVPATGPCILASNHLSFSDSVFMPLVVPRKVTYLAKAEYFNSPGIKGFVQKLTFIALGQVPVDRSGGRRSEAALLTGLKILSEGDCLGIYPEGTRSPDGRLYRGRTGVARMALEARVPVIPVAMVGTYEIQPVDRSVPKIGRVGIIFGKPLDFSQYYEDARNAETLRKVTNEIMEAIRELSGQEYVDIYASAAKEALKEKE